MASESIAHSAFGLMSYWLRAHYLFLNLIEQIPLGDCHVIMTGMFVVSPRGVNCIFWCHLGCSGPCALKWGRALRRFLYRVVYLGWLKGSSLQLTRTYERYAILLPFSNSSMSSPHFSFQSTRKNEAEIANWTPNYAMWTSIILLFSVVFFKSSPLARPRVVLVGGWWPPPSSSCVAEGFVVCFSFVFRKVRGTKKPPAT